MIEWNEQHLMIRDMMRKFIQAEVVPNREQIEEGGVPPYDIMRKLVNTFGLAEAARMRYEAEKQRAEAAEAARARGEAPARKERNVGGRRRRGHGHAGHSHHRAVQVLPGPGDRDGRQHGAHCGRHHGAGARGDRRTAGPCRC